MAANMATSQASKGATAPKIYLILSRRSKAFSLKTKSFQILKHIKDLREGLHQHPPPPCTTVRVGLWVYFRGLKVVVRFYEMFSVLTNDVTNRWFLKKHVGIEASVKNILKSSVGFGDVVFWIVLLAWFLRPTVSTAKIVPIIKSKTATVAFFLLSFFFPFLSFFYSFPFRSLVWFWCLSRLENLSFDAFSLE